MSPFAEVALIWVTVRASGIAALLCSSASLSLGLLMAIGPIRLRTRKLELRAAHEAAAVATFALILLHALALYFDPLLRPAGFTGLLVPLLGPYRPVATALGQVAAYGMLGLGLTFYLRRRLGVVRWKRAHRWISAFWALGVAHGVLVGTDADAPWFLLAVALPSASAAALLSFRLRTAAAPVR